MKSKDWSGKRIDKRLSANGCDGWWWSLDATIAGVIQRGVKHLLESEWKHFEDDDQEKLQTIRRFFKGYPDTVESDVLADDELEWLQAEAFWLLNSLYTRMWD